MFSARRFCQYVHALVLKSLQSFCFTHWNIVQNRITILIIIVVLYYLYTHSNNNYISNYLMSKYKISHLDWNLSLLHVLNKIEVPPLSVYELSVCNTVRELCQFRDNLYSCDIYIDTTDINAMLNVVCTE